MARATPLGDWAVSVYDHVYRVCHELDSARAAVPPLLCVEVRRCRGLRRLSDGVRVRAGDRIGVLHLNNRAVVQIHGAGRQPIAIGLEFRRGLLRSLRRLAVESEPGRPFAAVTAFTAVTIFHRQLQRLGFEVEPRGLWWPRLTGLYQCRLLAVLHPDGPGRLVRLPTRRAERLWMSRERLVARYGGVLREAV